MKTALFDRFTGHARNVMSFAREEAVRFHHEMIDSEHLLLGLLRERTGAAACVLDYLKVDLDQMRSAVELAMTPAAFPAEAGPLPFTPRAKRILEQALDEARSLDRNYVGTEHLLLGLIREEVGIAGQVMGRSGLTPEGVRKEVVAFLGTQASPLETVPGKSGGPNPSKSYGIFDRFSDRARKSLGFARQAAERFHHDHIGTEHLLLGVVMEGCGVAAHVLESVEADLDLLRKEVEGRLTPSTSPAETGPLPFTPRAKRALELAIDEARSFKHNYVGTEHLLLGLIREGEGIASQVLLGKGLTSEGVRTAIIDFHGAETPPRLPSLSVAKLAAKRILDYFSKVLKPLRRGRDADLFERFTDQARKVMSLAREEAVRFHHDYIGTEHVLLGLTKEASGVAALVLSSLGVDPDQVRQEAEKFLKVNPNVTTLGQLPLTPRAKNVMNLAKVEALALGHDSICTQHLLLGLLREQKGLAAQILMNLGLQLDQVRQEVVRHSGDGAERNSSGDQSARCTHT